MSQFAVTTVAADKFDLLTKMLGSKMMKVMVLARVRKIACLLMMMGFLVACGGGSPSTPATPSAPPTPPTNTMPTANAGPDQTVNEGATVVLAGSGSDVEGAVTYAWTQVSGPAITLSSTAIHNPTFAAPLVNAATTIQLRLTVTDSANATAIDTVVITVNDVVANTPPTANAGTDQTVDEGVTVTLLGSGSDAQGAVTYQWTQLSGTTVALSNVATASPAFVAPMVTQNNDLIFQFTVIDSDNTSVSDTVTVTVRDLVVGALPNTQVLAAPGMQAPGYPSGFVYQSLLNSDPVIGRNGDVAYSGTVRNSQIIAATSFNAVWAGRAGRLSAIIKENDSIQELPSDVLFASGAMLTVTSSGRVGMWAQLKGPGTTSANGVAILAYVDGATKKVLRVGDQAPGFPSGVTVTGVSHYLFSDGGMVIVGATGSGYAIWRWDFNSVDLLVRDGQSVPSYPNCTYAAGSVLFYPVKAINDAGTIIFDTLLTTSNVNTAPCDLASPLKWQAGSVSAVLGPNALVPNMNAAVSSRTASINGINDSGGATLRWQFFVPNLSTLMPSAWYKDSNSAARLIVLYGETVPNDFTASVKAVINSGINNSGMVATHVEAANTGAGVNTDYILRGQVRPTVPYASPADAGASQLTLVAHKGMHAPGFTSTSVFSDIDTLVITNQNDVLFTARVAHASNSGAEGSSVWRYDAHGVLQCILFPGTTILDNGTTRTANNFVYRADSQVSIGNGLGVQHSDTNQIVVRGNVSDVGTSVLLTTY